MSLDLAQEELLDLQHPLRHLQQADDDGPIIPHQPHSIRNELSRIVFPHPHHVVEISLAVDATPGCGGIAWPAGEVLSRYLVYKGPTYVQSKSILELGSGTGLVGLVAAKLGCPSVWITDQAPLLDIMNRNIHLNNLSESVKAVELNWGTPIPHPNDSPPNPDLILAADCVYFEPTFPLLVQTLSDLSTSSTEILFCYKKRRKADKRFFTLLKKQFTWEEVHDPERAIYTREAISLLSLKKRNKA
ncbi:hypothetical protein BDN72DRAFT_759811 [Pluteus cervinus]|uniref:Uncharacterized protein n=1 Tax=Pluteus cervinus TaxID=181527 RepID=A0ACD3BA41_9AGAR|nr:hypothetical protein BDN72DRAFT_759811 [Pluteus cervinus]